MGIGAIHLDNCWDGAGEAVGASLDHAERAGESAEAPIDGEAPMIMRVISLGIGREAPCWAMFKALVDRQDQQPPGAAEAALHQDAGQIRLGAGIVALIVGEDLANALCNFHFCRSCFVVPIRRD